MLKLDEEKLGRERTMKAGGIRLVVGGGELAG